MKSRSRKLPPVPPLDLVPKLRQKVLLDLAEELGPSVDQVETPVPMAQSEVGVVRQFVEQGAGSPAEVRVALADLVTLGCIECVQGSRVMLTNRGLVMARAIKPGVGASRTRSLRFALQGEEKGLWGILSTGDKSIDSKLRRGGVHLACFALFHARGLSPSDRLTLEDVGECLERLARNGVGPRSGPGTRIRTSTDTIASALDDLRRWKLLLLSKEHDDRDERVHRYRVAGPLPAVAFSKPASRLDPRSWSDYVRVIGSHLATQRPAAASSASPTAAPSP